MNSVTPSRAAERFESGGQLARAAASGSHPRRSARPDGDGRSAARDRRRARQLLPPVGELASQHLALQPAALPDGEVGILHGQLAAAATDGPRRTPRRAPAAPGSRISIDQPSADDVMHRQQQHVAARSRASTASPAAEVRDARSNGRWDSSAARAVTSPSRAIPARPRRSTSGSGTRWRGPPGRSPAAARRRRRKGGAQRLVPPQHLRQGLLRAGTSSLPSRRSG